MYNNGNTILLEKEATTQNTTDFSERTTLTKNKINLENDLKSNFDKLMNYNKTCEIDTVDNYEDITNEVSQNVDAHSILFGDSVKRGELATVTQEVSNVEVEENLRPSNTTMQFGLNYRDEIEQDIQRLNSTNKTAESRYEISFKAKVMIAVYGFILATVIALIAINSVLIKSLDNKISSYQNVVTTMTEKVNVLSSELEYTMSDEVVIKKAEEIGFSFQK